MNAPSAPDAPSSQTPTSSISARIAGAQGPDGAGAALDRDGRRPLDGTSATTARCTAKLKAIALLPSASYQAMYGREEQAALEELVTFVARRLSRIDSVPSAESYSQVEALFTGWDTPKIDHATLAIFPALRVVFHAGGSVKFITSDALWERGVRVTSAARANAVPVAEFTFAQVILGLKQAFPLARATRAARRFIRNDTATPSVYGSTVGLLSLGTIGRLVTDRLRSLDVRVIAYDPCVSLAEASALGVELVPLEEIFTRADVVSCHTPVLEETRGLLREHHFASMKPHATFINTARGAIVHEPGLVAVLQRRPDLFAVLDVTDPEPPESESALYSLPNVFLTPHISGSIGPECRRMGRMMIDEVRRYLAGKPLVGEITREQLAMLA